MFKVQSLALTAALFGIHSADATACYPAYRSGADYTVDDWVSFSYTEDVVSSCTDGTAGCVNGQKTTATKFTFNYKCISQYWCPQAGYAPNSLYESRAWSKEGAECTGSQGSAVPPTPAGYNGANSGCPAAYVGGTAYDAGDLVSVQQTYFTAVYKCADAPTNQFCGMAGYEAGEGLYTDQAWTLMGSCEGSLSPTGSPSFEVLADAGGCPGEYEGGAAYEEGDRVSKDGFVYQCKGWPASAHCSQAGYEPGMDVPNAEDPYWKQAWTVAGYCSGTISPTGAPSYDVLISVGGCPEEWEAKTVGDAYEEGDRVSDGKLVYACKGWPMSSHCGQAGYEPNTDPATPEAWKDAWSVIGWCDGTVGPTASPSHDPATMIGACPEAWEGGDAYRYEEGDMVSVTVSEVPLRKMAYKCKAWPYSGHCNQYDPLNELGGPLGWTLVGGCDGSIGPTASPSFDKLAVAGPCPEEWNKNYDEYEAGDLVSYTVSTAPERKLLFECKAWPNVGYCNQGSSFEPTTTYGNMAWILKGHCDGTIAPTSAPQVYGGTCTYEKTFEDVNCAKGVDGPTGGTYSSGGTVIAPQGICSCATDDDDCTSGTLDIKTSQTVNKYSKTVNYDFGDVVRIGAQRFKCKHWPNGLWCANDAYAPTMEPGIWSDAWTKDGMCT